MVLPKKPRMKSSPTDMGVYYTPIRLKLVIARSVDDEQSIFPLCRAMDCFRLRQGFGGQVATLAMTVDRVPHSRGAIRPRFAEISSALSNTEGAGNAGCALHPRSRAQCAQEVRARAYRAAESIRHSLRNGFTAYFVLSPENGSFASVAP